MNHEIKYKFKYFADESVRMTFGLAMVAVSVMTPLAKRLEIPKFIADENGTRLGPEWFFGEFENNESSK